MSESKEELKELYDFFNDICSLKQAKEYFAWEFLRRNEDYIEAYRELERKYPAFVCHGGLDFQCFDSLVSSHYVYSALELEKKYLELGSQGRFDPQGDFYHSHFFSEEERQATFESDAFQKDIQKFNDTFFVSIWPVGHFLPAPDRTYLDLQGGLFHLAQSPEGIISREGKVHSTRDFDSLLKVKSDYSLSSDQDKLDEQALERYVTTSPRSIFFRSENAGEVGIMVNLNGNIFAQIKALIRVLLDLQKRYKKLKKSKRIEVSSLSCYVNALFVWQARKMKFTWREITDFLYKNNVNDVKSTAKDDLKRARKMIGGDWRKLVSEVF